MNKAAKLKRDVELQPQQERVLERLKTEPSLLVYHGLGSGKTLASIAAGEDAKTKQIVVPASLRENYRKELRKFVGRPKGYDVKSYQKAISEGLAPADLTVFDEAHRLGREGTQISALPKGLDSKKTLFLTGTPVRNAPNELVPILKVLAADRGAPQSAEAFDKMFVRTEKTSPGILGYMLGERSISEDKLVNLKHLKEMLKGRVDYHAPTGEFPSVKHENVEVEMSPRQTELYRALMQSRPNLYYKVRNNLPPNKTESKQLNAFLAATRQVSNNPMSYDTSLRGSPIKHSPKLVRMLQDIERGVKKDKNFKAYTYSNYLDSGISPLSEALTAKGIPNALFSGKLNDLERKKIVEDYNKGRLKVLLASAAGTEGLDLKGTKLVQLMEPHWNTARLEQAVGRAIRHGSHAHLSPEEQKVVVRNYHINPQQDFWSRIGFTNPETGADSYLSMLAARKKKLVNQLLDVLKSVGSEPVQQKAAWAVKLLNVKRT